MGEKDSHAFKGQTQEEPGREFLMDPEPIYDNPDHEGLGRLKGKVAIVTGGDSGIGRAVSVAFAREEAKVVIVYNVADKDANDTIDVIKGYKREAILIKGDIGDSSFAEEVINRTIEEYGQLDILVNNAGEQHPQNSIEDISDEQLERTFRTNIFSMFYLTKKAIPHMKAGSSIINTGSITSYLGNPTLLDYSASKGAVASFTKSLALQLAENKIKVNQVAPGPIWTPLIPSTFDKEMVKTFGEDTPYERAGQPVELAEAYVYLASNRATYITGQTIHINGGQIIG